MNLIDMNLPQRFNLGKLVSDTESTLKASMKMVGRYKDDEYSFGILVAYLKVYGICVRELSNGIAVVYWTDDERADVVLEASLAELPEFLTDDDYSVRLLAVHRLEELNK